MKYFQFVTHVWIETKRHLVPVYSWFHPKQFVKINFQTIFALNWNVFDFCCKDIHCLIKKKNFFLTIMLFSGYCEEVTWKNSQIQQKVEAVTSFSWLYCNNLRLQKHLTLSSFACIGQVYFTMKDKTHNFLNTIWKRTVFHFFTL